MVTFPNCKINIGLHVTGKRPDGYHNIQTVFYPLAFRDALEILVNTQVSNDFFFSTSGNSMPVEETDNICVKAYHLLKGDFPHIPSLRIHLHKAIPVGAGLGGGSSDATGILLMINEKCGLGLTKEQLGRYAMALGSDCAFFLENTACYAEGRGDILGPIQLDLSKYKFMLVNPRIMIHTGTAFAGIKNFHTSDLKAAITKPISSWKDSVFNDFEPGLFGQYPQIAEIKKTFYQNGALYASLSGSGSTVFGIFENEIALAFPEHYLTTWI
jgi:4-diphosphocytidyl-2-C-methyl-D-erythritol kinase